MQMSPALFKICCILSLSATPAFDVSVTNAYADEARMDGPALKAIFPGMTMTGKYSDGLNFRETYHPDGSITYVDDLSADKGRWFVRGKLFCTFYEASDGACFSVQKSGDNCFEYFVQEEEDGSPAANPGQWNSIGWDETKPSTCDLAPKTA
jgi:hypothetical protein